MSLPNSSIFNLFTIGIGPSSSHTVGPMKAARRFALLLEQSNLLNDTHGIGVELFGSLALTGKGHGTDGAIQLGLVGEQPHLLDPDSIEKRLKRIPKIWNHPVPAHRRRNRPALQTECFDIGR